MSQGVKDPITGKTFIYKGFTPSSRIAEKCGYGKHSECLSSPQILINHFPIEYTKQVCCLCQCHFEEVK